MNHDVDHLRAAARRWLAPGALRDRPPLWREGRWVLELRALRRDPIFAGRGVPPGRGRPVLLIPGYLAGDASLRVMARWLKRAGYRPVRAGITFNADCAGRTLDALAERVRRVAPRWSGAAWIVGQSRGGCLGRLLVARHPERFACLITLGSPLIDPLAVHPLVLLNVGVVGTLGRLGVPGLLTADCWTGGECCRLAYEESLRPPPPGVRLVSIYSRTDGIVDWRACLDPGARHVEVDASHLGMGAHPAVYRAIAAELGRQDG